MSVKSYELRNKSKEELENLLIQYKKELAELRVQQLQRPSLPKVKTVRKNIARVLTVINEQHRDAVRQLYMNKKHQPKDLRNKKTKQIRNNLTKNESNKILLKHSKRNIAYPQLKYAIKE